jgi:hypothetical protein
MSNEEPIVATLRTSLPADGLYFFPSIDLRGSPTQEEQGRMEARFRAGPTLIRAQEANSDRESHDPEYKRA